MDVTAELKRLTEQSAVWIDVAARRATNRVLMDTPNPGELEPQNFPLSMRLKGWGGEPFWPHEECTSKNCLAHPSKNIIPADLGTSFSSLTSSWRADTSADENWSKDNPALGQCAVTALVIQSVFGGDLLRAEVNGVSHYWNRLPDGRELDLTRSQFTGPLTYGEVVVRDREYVLSFPATVERLNRLLDRMAIHSDWFSREVYLRLNQP